MDNDIKKKKTLNCKRVTRKTNKKSKWTSKKHQRTRIEFES